MKALITEKTGLPLKTVSTMLMATIGLTVWLANLNFKTDAVANDVAELQEMRPMIHKILEKVSFIEGVLSEKNTSHVSDKTSRRSTN